jgi:hypothetical protein
MRIRARYNSEDENIEFPTEYVSPLAVNLAEAAAASGELPPYVVTPEEREALLVKLAEAEENVKKHGRGYSPYARGTHTWLAEVKRLLAGEEQPQIALRWLRNRAKGLKGEFDESAFRYGLYYLPGWSWSIRPVNVAVTDIWNVRRTVERFGGKPEENKMPYTRQPELWKRAKPKDAPNLPPGLYAASPIKPSTFTPGPWTRDTYFAADGWFEIEKPFVVEPGGQVYVVSNGRETRESTAGAGLWKALYELGLQEAAAQIADKMQATKAQARESWGKEMCPICFGYASVTPTSKRMVDHGHKRPGWGYNVGPCEGNECQPFSTSKECTEEARNGLVRLLQSLLSQLAYEQSSPDDWTYTVREWNGKYQKDQDGRYLRDAHHNLVKEMVERKVTRRDPDYAKIQQASWARRKAQAREFASHLRFYNAALSVWTPNNKLTPSDVVTAMKGQPEIALPALGNPRRAPRAPRPPRRR